MLTKHMFEAGLTRLTRAALPAVVRPLWQGGCGSRRQPLVRPAAAAPGVEPGPQAPPDSFPLAVVHPLLGGGWAEEQAPFPQHTTIT